MNTKNVGIAALVLGVILFARGNFFASTPVVQVSGAEVRVGKDDGNRAQYTLDAPVSFSAVSLGYDFNSGGDFLGKLGSRGIVSFLDEPTYKSIVALQCKTGQCMASYINAKESTGQVGHLLLIPADEDAMKKMRSARIPDGHKFRLKGRSLNFVSASIDGQSFDGKLTHTGYFLLESIDKE